jgi:hypothetical protein
MYLHRQFSFYCFLLFCFWRINNDQCGQPVTIEERNNYISKLEASLKKDAKNIWFKERIAFAKDTTHHVD